jgi:hypothetical protein
VGGDAPPQFLSPVVTPSSPDGEFRIDWKLRTQDPRPQSSEPHKARLGGSTILKRAAHSRLNIDLGIERGKSFDVGKVDPAIKTGLETAPEDALKLMTWEVNSVARVVNGWSMNTDTMGVYGNYYLKRAIITQLGLGAPVGQSFNRDAETRMLIERDCWSGSADRALAACERPHRSAAPVRLSRSAAGDPSGGSFASAHRRLAVGLAPSALSRSAAGGSRRPQEAWQRVPAGATAKRSPCEFKPALGTSASWQTGSEAITYAADGVTSKSDETPATPILSCAAIGSPRTA